jgi:hypothetical protein
MPFAFHPWQTIRRFVVRQFARILTKPFKSDTARVPNDLEAMKRHLKKGDILLVEGAQRVSEVIKYLTQSSWSHAGIYIGDELIRRRHPQAGELQARWGDEARYLMIEALLEEGVIVSPVSKYLNFNLRVCRPTGLRREDLDIVLDEVIDQLGYPYDLQNVLDLARYFLPFSLVPSRFRRKALQFGSGAPTRVICSSMLAAAFDKVGFPIMPWVTVQEEHDRPGRFALLSRMLPFAPPTRPRFVFHRSHPTLITPRDFDLSPYFGVVKSNITESGRFDYSKIVWAEDEDGAAVLHPRTGKEALVAQLSE